VPEPTPFLGRYAVLYGMGLGTVVYAVGFGLSLTALGGDRLAWFGTWAVIAGIVTLGVLAGGIVCVSIRRTRSFGAGLLISLAIGLFVGNGACIAIVSHA